MCDPGYEIREKLLPDPKGTVFRIATLFNLTCCFLSFGFGGGGARQPRLGRVYETGGGWKGGGGGGAYWLLPRLVAGQRVLLLLVQRPAQRQLPHTLTLPPQGDLLHKRKR
jgi:hypothetical protein